MGILLFRSELAQPQLAQRFKIWFLILKVSNYFYTSKSVHIRNKKGKKNEVTFSFQIPVEAVILKERKRNLTTNFYCKEAALDTLISNFFHWLFVDEGKLFQKNDKIQYDDKVELGLYLL